MHGLLSLLGAAGLGTATSPGIPWLRITLSLAFCIGIAFAAILLLRHHRRAGLSRTVVGRFAKRNERLRREIDVVETRRLSPHADICLMECRGTSYLLLVGPTGSSVIDSHSTDTAETTA